MTDIDKTGGPAFPRSGPYGANDGMTLRDYFAAQAIPIVVLKYAADNKGVGTDHLPGNCAIIAYRIADAMIIERSKP